MSCSFPRLLAVAFLALMLLTGCSEGSSAGLTVGDDAPDFALPASSGSTVALDDYSGAPALLYFHMADG
jgi:hypothetical protein